MTRAPRRGAAPRTPGRPRSGRRRPACARRHGPRRRPRARRSRSWRWRAAAARPLRPPRCPGRGGGPWPPRPSSSSIAPIRWRALCEPGHVPGLVLDPDTAGGAEPEVVAQLARIARTASPGTRGRPRPRPPGRAARHARRSARPSSRRPRQVVRAEQRAIPHERVRLVAAREARSRAGSSTCVITWSMSSPATAAGHGTGAARRPGRGSRTRRRRASRAARHGRVAGSTSSCVRARPVRALNSSIRASQAARLLAQAGPELLVAPRLELVERACPAAPPR